MKLRGMVLRAKDPSAPLIDTEALELPAARVPVWINFDQDKKVGDAKLTRDAAGNIWAEVDVVEKPEIRKYFAIGVLGEIKAGRVVGAEIASVGIVNKNLDRSLPPFEVIR